MNSADPPSLGFLLADASRLLRHRFERESRDIAMTPAQLRIVARLSRNEGIGQAALASLLELKPMTLSRHIDRMEAAHLVERRPDPDDRRARRLHTTGKSRALLGPMRRRASAVYDDVLTGLDAQQRTTLLHALETIVANLCQTEGDVPEATPAFEKNA